MIRRYVSRARGQALRAAGVPRTPNLPSARALGQRELRNATRVGGRRPSRRASHHADVPAADNPAVRTGRPSGTSASPYDDPSRDVGEGPDQFTPVQHWVLLVGLVVAVLLVVATCGYQSPPNTTDDHCHAYCRETQR